MIVDQFEAVFTLCADEGERRALIDGLCELARTGLVVLALRADFYQQAIRYPGLLRAAQERHVVLGPMSAGQVRRAVVEPARLARTEVAAGWSRCCWPTWRPDTDGSGAHEPGALPMLSHALLAAWEHSRGGTLDGRRLPGQRRDQGRAHPVRRTRLREPRCGQRGSRGGCSSGWCMSRTTFRPAARRCRSMSCSAGSALAPRPGRLGLLAGRDAERVLAVFIDERMITVDSGTARLTHDALLTAWPRLRAWIEESTEELRDRRRIS